MRATALSDTPFLARDVVLALENYPIHMASAAAPRLRDKAGSAPLSRAEHEAIVSAAVASMTASFQRRLQEQQAWAHRCLQAHKRHTEEPVHTVEPARSARTPQHSSSDAIQNFSDAIASFEAHSHEAGPCEQAADLPRITLMTSADVKAGNKSLSATSPRSTSHERGSHAVGTPSIEATAEPTTGPCTTASLQTSAEAPVEMSAHPISMGSASSEAVVVVQHESGPSTLAVTDTTVPVAVPIATAASATITTPTSVEGVVGPRKAVDSTGGASLRVGGSSAATLKEMIVPAAVSSTAAAPIIVATATTTASASTNGPAALTHLGEGGQRERGPTAATMVSMTTNITATSSAPAGTDAFEDHTAAGRHGPAETVAVAIGAKLPPQNTAPISVLTAVTSTAANDSTHPFSKEVTTPDSVVAVIRTASLQQRGSEQGGALGVAPAVSPAALTGAGLRRYSYAIVSKTNGARGEGPSVLAKVEPKLPQLSPQRPVVPAAARKQRVSETADKGTKVDIKRDIVRMESNLLNLKTRTERLRNCITDLDAAANVASEWKRQVAERQIQLNSMLVYRRGIRGLLKDIHDSMVAVRSGNAIPTSVGKESANRIAQCNNDVAKVCTAELAFLHRKPQETAKASTNHAAVAGKGGIKQFRFGTSDPNPEVATEVVEGVIAPKFLRFEQRVRTTLDAARASSEAIRRKMIIAEERYHRIGAEMMGRAGDGPMDEARYANAVSMAMTRECEAELAGELSNREKMRGLLLETEESLNTITAQVAALRGADALAAESVAVEHADLLEHSGSDSGSASEGDDDPYVDVANILHFGHQQSCAATQCDVVASDIPRPSSAVVSRFERLFKGERELVVALRSLAVAMAHALFCHWAIAGDLTCRRCLTTLSRSAIVWPCGHTVCSHCIQRSDEALRCGDCNIISEMGFTPNELLDNLVRIQKGLPFPLDDHPYDTVIYAAILDLLLTCQNPM